MLTVVSVCLRPMGNMTELTFPSDFAVVCVCESEQGQLLRNKSEAFCICLSSLQKDQLGTERRRAVMRLNLLFFFKTRVLYVLDPAYEL